MLHVPVGANAFNLTLPSWGTTRPSNTFTTSVTPAVGSKGSWAQLGSDLVDDTFGLLINISNNSASAASRNTVVDIGVDESGGTSYSVLIADLLAGGAATYTAGLGIWYYFPIFIPAGAAVAARAQGTVTTALRVGCVHMQRPYNPSMIRKGSFVETLGITAPDGTAITPGTTSEGSWTSLGTTSKRCWWWQAGIQVNAADTSWNAGAIHLDVAVGDGTNFDIIIQDLGATTATTETMLTPPLTAGVEWDVPAGSTIYVRAQHSGTLDAYTCAVYGLGG